MWKGMRGKWAAMFVIISWMHVVVALSSSAGGSSPSQYSRRINVRSKSPANLHLQTLRSSRQTPDLPALYSAPKEREAKEAEGEAQAQAPPPAAVYGPPADLNDDSSAATTEMATEENLEGASTSAPSEAADEDGGEVVESEVTERTEYLPPSSTPTKRRRLKDQKMVESSPIHQIQIHVVPPHLSQGDHNGEILGSSYGVPEMMMMSHPEYIRGQYLPPQQGQQVDGAAKQEEQKGSSYGGSQARDEGSDSRQQQQLPSTEYETPRRDEEPVITGQPKKSSNPQIYHVPTTYQAPSTNQLGYSTRSRSKPQAQQYRQQDVPNQQQQNNYPTHQTQYNNLFPSTQGYQTPTQQQGQQQSFSRNQPEGYQGGYSQNGKQGYQQGNQIVKAYPSNFNPNQDTVADYQTSSAIDQGGYPQRSYQGNYSPTPAAQQQYSLNQVTNEEEQQDDAVVIQGFPSSQQNQPDQQFQQDYQTFNHNYVPQTPTNPQSQETLAQTQSPAEYGPPQSFFEPQTYSLPSSTSSFSGVSGGYPQQQVKNHYQPQPQAYDQQPLTSNSNLRQPQQHQAPPSQTTFQNTPLSQYDSRGYPESRSQPQRNNPSSHSQPIPPSTQPQQTVTNPQAQYFQGNFLSQPAQPQFRSNSLDFESQQDEELEGLNGRIVDEALLARVQQIIEEHERQQKSLLANFNSNAPPSSPSSSEYSSGVQFNPQQQQLQQQGGGGQPSPIVENYKLSQPQGGLEQRRGESQEGYGSYNPDGIQYQKAILSQQFTETSPIPTTQQQQQDSYAPPPPQQPLKGQAEDVGRSKSDGLRLVPAPQLGRSQDQVGESNVHDDVPKPVYGVPLAPVIGLDSNENFKVVDEPQQNSLVTSAASPVSNNYFQPAPQQVYGRNRRRVAGRVIKLNNASPRISIPYVN